MLDAETKRRIDTARDLLVGKVPDPKSQVEQITIALIYKFMDDIDAQSEELGGERSFFAGEFARYGWSNLMDPRLGGHETLDLYAEAIVRMPQNPGIPSLFRDIFNNAFLPYRDPETLREFLRVIDEFTYDNSERLGDAFEYLLSVLDSQGDAGQFRTPRHIIDFIVAVVDPKKEDAILDPACGTAGFLISSYKHILAATAGDDGRSALTPDDLEKLADNFTGYDISPDMVRLSLVNLYLHEFADPHIHEYDTLTSQDRWNEYADVILANPPFMSPKGGIRPHNRFSVKAKRSEVLFVDYMAEHLKPNGRAGIIVPEGIIFQSQTAYKQLRKMLVEEYLVAVVSLPSGVFQPYSGVKTSVLILDRELAKRADSIGFFKVENDGFDLGAQRRPIDRNDLPRVRDEIGEYMLRLRVGEPVDDFQAEFGLVVKKERVAEDGEYNLSGERYRENDVRVSRHPLVYIKEVAAVESGFGFPIAYQGNVDGGVPFLKVSDMNLSGNEVEITSWNNSISEQVLKELKARAFPAGTVIFPKIGAAIATNKKRILTRNCAYDNNVMGVVSDNRKLLPKFLYAYLLQFDISRWASDAQPPSIRKTVVQNHQIPLPPMEVQQEIVAEIEGYQKVIDGARAVVDNYRPHIVVDPEWSMVALDTACQIERGKFSHRPRNEPRFYGGRYPFIQTGDIVRANGGAISYTQTLNDEGLAISRLFQPPIVVITIAANIGSTAVLDFPSCFPDSVIGLIPKPGANPWFLELMMRTKKDYLNTIAPQSAQKNINIQILKTIELPLPSLETQRAIVAEAKAELALVDANRELMERFEKKIEAVVGRVWAK